MVKMTVITVLLVIVAYCSYFLVEIRRWQRLLTNKQQQFGVHHEPKSEHAWLILKQMRMVALTAVAIAIVVPNAVYPGSKPVQNGVMLAESSEKIAADTTGSLNLTVKSAAMSLLDQWSTIQNDVNAISEIIIETYESADEQLTEARVKSLLIKDLVQADLGWEQEEYVVKLRIGDTWIVLLLTSIDGNFYVFDQNSKMVYRLQ